MIRFDEKSADARYNGQSKIAMRNNLEMHGIDKRIVEAVCNAMHAEVVDVSGYAVTFECRPILLPKWMTIRFNNGIQIEAQNERLKSRLEQVVFWTKQILAAN